jgi:hypothetical protein
MYTTTRDFLELFGLKDLSSLPDLEELRLIETPREEPIFANLDDSQAPDVLLDTATAPDGDSTAGDIVVEVGDGYLDPCDSPTPAEGPDDLEMVRNDVGEEPPTPDLSIDIASDTVADPSSDEPEVESASPPPDTDDHD